MPILVHIARESDVASIRKGGLRAGRCTLETRDGTEMLRGVFSYPVLESFSQSYQWARELRRHHDERVVGVYVRAQSDEEVLVGRYSQTHQRMRLSDAIRWVRAHPWGAQVLLPRRVAAREVHAIRGITQLVGWTGAPHDTLLPDCVCAMCLPPGTREIGRRVRAAFQRQLRLARAATDTAELVSALRGMEPALERIGSRVGIKPILVYARHPDDEVRKAVAFAFGYCRSDALISDQLALMARDASDDVAATAAQALLSVGARARFLRVAESMSESALTEVVDHLQYVSGGRELLGRLAGISGPAGNHAAAVLARLSDGAG